MTEEDLRLMYAGPVYLNYAYILSSCMHTPTGTFNLVGKTALLSIELSVSLSRYTRWEEHMLVLKFFCFSFSRVNIDYCCVSLNVFTPKL